MRKLFALAAAASLALLAADAPAGETSIAFTLATGADIEDLQQRVDALERKAIANEHFTTADKAFLHDLYAAMATGAKHSVVLAQSGRMMDRYLDGSGKPLELDASIFRDNARVRRQMNALALQIGKSDRFVRSPRFYMPDASKLDSVTGLYWGTVEARPRTLADGTRVVHFRAEVPWEWPSYESLRKKYGTPHAETFLLPNLRSLASGPAYALHIENGLGEYLVRLGLAKPFVAWAEWDEPLGAKPASRDDDL